MPRTTKPRVIEVEIDRLQFDPEQPRRTIDEDELAQLAASMSELGRTAQLVTARPHPEGGYVVVSGERRVRAARSLGWDTLPVLLDDHVADPVARLAAQVAENVARSSLTPIELCVSVGRLRSTGLDASQVADRIGMSRRSAYNYFRILDRPDLVDRLRDGATLRSVLKALVSSDVEPRVQPEVEVPRRTVRRFERTASELAESWNRLRPDERETIRALLADVMIEPDGQKRLFT